MSKVIKITSEYIEECLDEFKKELTSAKLVDGKINFSKTVGALTRKAKIFFEEKAWTKMQALVREFDKEVAWHGVAFRGDDAEKDEYIIKDILVYPQKVTGSTVEMDTEEYAKWIEDNIDDERFCDIRMQGHSHVNMGVFASPVDITHQEAILEQLSDNMFYIFMIWNKRGEKNIKIFDIAKNVLFETADIDVEVIYDGCGVDSFVREAKSQVKEKVYTGYQYSYQGKNYTPVPIVSNTDKKEPEKKESPTTVVQSNKPGKRKGKKKKNKHKNYSYNNACDETQISYFRGQGYDPSDPFAYYGY